MQLAHIGNYFVKEEPKQLFVGAELCARWYGVVTGRSSSKVVAQVIAYTTQAQEVFCWPLTLSNLGTLASRVVSLRLDLKTLSTLSETISLTMGCAEIVVREYFKSQAGHVPTLKTVGLVSDLVIDVISWMADGEATQFSISTSFIKKIVSLAFSTLSIGTFFFKTLEQNRKIQSFVLGLQTAVWVSKIVYHISQQPIPPSEPPLN